VSSDTVVWQWPAVLLSSDLIIDPRERQCFTGAQAAAKSLPAPKVRVEGALSLRLLAFVVSFTVNQSSPLYLRIETAYGSGLNAGVGNFAGKRPDPRRFLVLGLQKYRLE
jgi:hypothetical protein